MTVERERRSTCIRGLGTIARRLARATGVLAATALAVGSPAGGAVSASAAATGQAPRPAYLSIDGILTGVATNSSRDAWAVGMTPLGQPDRPILAHWDGRAWKIFTTAALPSFGGLAAVTPVEGGDWVVGHSGYVPEGAIGHVRPLILRLSGKAWKRMPLPDTGKGSLSAVTATSASNAWAVGYINNGPPLILHWNGRAWARAPLPKIGTGNFLRGVAATSATDAWAVGNHRGKALILHWGGKRWRQVATPPPVARSETLSAVTATSARNAWVVGYAGSGTLILHWNGTAWKRMRGPDLSRGAVLRSVDASSATSAWAVGLDGSSNCLILHWNGRSWRRAPANGSADSSLNSVSIGPSGRAWAVGYAGQNTLFLHWNGATWH
jgi:hypothetical protein